MASENHIIQVTMNTLQIWENKNDVEKELLLKKSIRAIKKYVENIFNFSLKDRSDGGKVISSTAYAEIGPKNRKLHFHILIEFDKFNLIDVPLSRKFFNYELQQVTPGTGLYVVKKPNNKRMLMDYIKKDGVKVIEMKR